jgi:hypothetical protein
MAAIGRSACYRTVGVDTGLSHFRVVCRRFGEPPEPTGKPRQCKRFSLYRRLTETSAGWLNLRPAPTRKNPNDEAIYSEMVFSTMPRWGGNANELDRLAVEAEKLMQAWADYLDNLRKGADVVPLRVA